MKQQTEREIDKEGVDDIVLSNSFKRERERLQFQGIDTKTDIQR